jgi:rhodanese-related sulfurtransferase
VNGHDAAALARIPRISAAETWERLKRGEPVLVVDVRKPIAHQRAHIAGDLSHPTREHAERKGELPRDRLLVLY